MPQSTEATDSTRTRFSRKACVLALGAMAAVALAVPAAPMVAAAGHDGGGGGGGWKSPVIRPTSHRLAMSFSPASVRLT